MGQSCNWLQAAGGNPAFCGHRFTKAWIMGAGIQACLGKRLIRQPGMGRLARIKINGQQAADHGLPIVLGERTDTRPAVASTTHTAVFIIHRFFMFLVSFGLQSIT
jgi:hypothetical protein